MKLRYKIILGCLILLLIIFHRYLFQAPDVEGFANPSSDYTALTERLAKDLGPYCKIASFVREQLKTMVSATGGAADDASLNEIYKSVYSCKDSMVTSRPSCKRLGPNASMQYVSCDTYLNLPPYSADDMSVTLALMKIKDSLPEQIIREAEWFSTIIEKVQDSLALGANPPAESPVGTRSKIDGFTGTCSVDAAKIKLAKKSQEEAKSCTIPNISSEITRINKLLDSPVLKKEVSQMNGKLNAMLKLQSDLEKAKNGTLYSWQQDGPTKSFPKFKGGDRTASFTFSMQQNQ